MQIKVLYHIIIGENRYFSFADAGLIEEYNSDFLSPKMGKESKPCKGTKIFVEAPI